MFQITSNESKHATGFGGCFWNQLAGSLFVLLALACPVKIVWSADTPAVPAVDAFIKEVSQLPPADQIKRVTAKIKELNPDWNEKQSQALLSGKDGVVEFTLCNEKWSHPPVKTIWPIRAFTHLKILNVTGSQLDDLDQIKGLGLTSLSLWATKVTDLTPLKGMKLTTLDLRGTKVKDLVPLQGMPLTSLDIGGVQVADLAPLKGMPLNFLDIRSNNKVKDLTPLIGMPLGSLNLDSTIISDLAPLSGLPLTSLTLGSEVKDLTPLKGMHLTSLDMSFNRNVTDLSPLTGMPLTTLNIQGSRRIEDLAPLKGLPLTALDISSTQVADLSPLKDLPLTSLNIRRSKVRDLSALAGMKLTGLNCSERLLRDLTPLKGMPLSTLDISNNYDLVDLTPLKGAPLTSLNITQTNVSDLTPLAGMPLSSLKLTQTKVTDIAPLKGMPFTSLDIGGLKVTDLAPLKGMPLTSLNICFTKVTDLLPLKGMPLTSLNISRTRITDLTPLKGMPLESLWITLTKETIPPLLLNMPPEVFDNKYKPDYADVLKGIPTLKTINGKPASEILDKEPPQKPPAGITPTIVKPDPATGAKAGPDVWDNTLWGHEHIVPEKRADKTRPDFENRIDAAKNEHRPYFLVRSAKMSGKNPKTITQLYVDVDLLIKAKSLVLDRYFVRYKRLYYVSTKDEIAEIATMRTYEGDFAETSEIKTCKPISIKLLAWQPLTAPPADFVPMRGSPMPWEEGWKMGVIAWVEVSGESDVPYAPCKVYTVTLRRDPLPDKEQVKDAKYGSDQFWLDLQLGGAIMRDEKESIQAFLKKGADINSRSLDVQKGSCLMHMAAMGGREPDDSRVKQFLALGAIADCTNADWITPLLMAADRGNVPAMKALIAAGADPTLCSRDHRWPDGFGGPTNALSTAVRMNRLEAVKYLVEEVKMDVNEPLPTGKMVADGAHGAMLDYLTKHGAKTTPAK